MSQRPFEVRDPYLDEEASEGTEDDFDSEAEDQFWHGELSDDEYPDERTFFQFGKLPPELRHRIWEFVALELTEPRILHFRLFETMAVKSSDTSRPPNTPTWIVYSGMGLPAQSLLARRVMAVNKEARQIVQKASPDTLQFTRTTNHEFALLSFNKKRDVVMVEGFEKVPRSSHFQLGGFAENITQLAINIWDFSPPRGDSSHFNFCLKLFSGLKRLFIASNDDEIQRTRDVLWCGSDFVYIYDYAFREIMPGFRDRRPTRVCWPNADQYDDYAKHHVPQTYAQGLPEGGRSILSKLGVEIYSMVVFEDSQGMAHFESLEQKWQVSLGGLPEGFLEGGSGLDDESSSIATEDDEQDEYESEGIDDDVIEDLEDNEEDEVDLDAVSGDDIIDGEGTSDDDDQTEQVEANFSSPELDGEPIHSSGTGLQPSLPRSNKRRIVADSDDENTPANATKRARVSRVVLSDSDENEPANGKTSFADTERSIVVLADEEETETESSQHTIEESESEDEEEESVPKRLSLAARLKIAREETQDSFDKDSHHDVHEEEEGDDDGSEDDEERSEDGLIDGVAEESDGEGNFDDDEEFY